MTSFTVIVAVMAGLIALTQCANLRKSQQAAVAVVAQPEERADASSEDTDAVAAPENQDQTPVAAASEGNYGGSYSPPSYDSYNPGYNKQSYGYEKGPGYYGPEGYGDSYGFQCAGKKPAFYGDAAQDCKVFYICQSDGRTDTFRCPKWTRFNNYLGICDWHFKVDNSCNPLDTYENNYQPSYSPPSYSPPSYSPPSYSPPSYSKY
ncbi:hypothetical protein BV898_04477 [Hypsibius exemplaris]|uniref:Chitin-binding type-2 domain-containing protein n=1 Tax=Hypsibius exemplaris TaxID=2072580 RepID=A0A1W0X263_HYPEX|nr:hypothetical protein BV898_04477 [Hypsibius exemplaris]